MSKVHVLGIGSPFGDDQLGWCIIDKLKQNTALKNLNNAILRMDAVDRPGVNILEMMKAAKRVYLIDAMQGKELVGHIYHWVNQDWSSLTFPISSHDVQLIEALAIGQTLSMLPNDLIVYGIEIGEQATPVLQKTISPQLFSAIDTVVTHLAEALKDDCYGC